MAYGLCSACTYAKNPDADLELETNFKVCRRYAPQAHERLQGKGSDKLDKVYMAYWPIVDTSVDGCGDYVAA